MTDMKILAAAGLAALAACGVATADEVRIKIDRDGPSLFMMERFGSLDGNEDGFISRDEAKAQAERMFAARDEDNDGKIDVLPHKSKVWHERGGRKAPKHAEGQRKEVRREVIIIRSDEDGDTEETRDIVLPPHPPGPPIGPMLLLFSSDEADLNGDGALSKQEFVTQQLRFYDAADANGDGKIKAPPLPPEPPEAPDAPPAPPRP